MATDLTEEETEGLQEIERRMIQVPSLKLSRTSKGLYSWEIKMIEIDPDKIEDINNQMLTKFGGTA